MAAALDKRGTPLEVLVKWALPIGCLATLAFGIAKLFLQRAHPPAYVVGKPLHLCQGFVAIDGHGITAAAIRDWFTGWDPGGVKLREFLSGSVHPSAIAVPAAVALLDLAVNCLPASYAILSAAALLLNARLAAAVVQEIDPHGPPIGPRLAALLVIGHCLTIRTSAQLIVDPFCALLVTSAILLTLRWIRRPRASTAALLLTVQLLGIFSKISYAPLFAIPAAAAPILGGRHRWKRAAAAAVLFGAVPALTWGLYLWALTGAVNPFERESRHRLQTWSLTSADLRQFAFEMALLFQGFVAIFLVKPRRLVPGANVVLATLALILVSTWAFFLPFFPRLYLPALAPLAILAVVKFRRLLDTPRAADLLGAYLAVNYTIGAAGLYFASRPSLL